MPTYTLPKGLGSMQDVIKRFGKAKERREFDISMILLR